MRARRAFLLLAAALAVLAAGSWLALRTTGIGQALVKNAMARLIRGRFGMSGADLDVLGGKVEIRDFNVTDPDRPDRELLTVSRVLVDISRNPLTAGALRMVTLNGISFHLRLGSGETPDLSRIIDTAGGGGEGSLPRIRVEESKCFLYLPGAAAPGWVFERIALDLLPAGAPAGTRAFSLQGRILAPLGGRFEVAGSLELPAQGAPRIRLNADCPEVTLTPGSFAAAPELDRLLEEHRPQGKLGVRMWLEYPDAEGRLSGGLRLEARELAFTPPEVPYRVTGLSGAIEARTGGGGTFLVDLAARSTRAAFALKGRVERPGRPDALWDLEADVKNLAIDRAVEGALLAAREPDIPRVWRAFLPRGGEVSAKIGLRSPPEGGRPEAAVDLEVSGVAAAFHGLEGKAGRRSVPFPYTIEDISGKIRVRPGGQLLVEGLRGRAGGGRVAVRGRILSPPSPAPDTMALRIEADRIAFGPELKAALAACLPEGGRIYDDYDPEGAFDGTVRIDRGPGDPGPKVSTELRPLGASARWRRVPYRVAGLAGKVEISPAGVAFDLLGGPREPVVELHGRFPFKEGGFERHMELTLTARDLELDERLRLALATFDPGLGELWETFAPAGRVGLELVAAGTPDGTGPRIAMGLELGGCAFAYRGFPAPVAQATGRVFVSVRPEAIQTDLLGIRGLAWGSPLTIFGSVTRRRQGDEPAAMDVTVVATEVRITETLGDLLHRGGFLNREVFDLLAAEGRIDVVQRLERRAGEKAITGSCEVQLLGVASGSRLLIDRATEVVGTVLAYREGLDILRLEGRIGEARVVVPRGSVRVGPQTTAVAIQATAERFPVDDRLARLMDAPVNRIYLERKTRAEVRLAPLELEFLVPRAGGPVETRFRGRFEALGGETILGVPLEEIRGPWTILDGVLRPGSTFARGHLEGVELRVAGFPVGGITGAFELTEKGVRIGEGRADFAGGSLSPREPGAELFWFGFEEPRPLRANLAFQGIELARVTAQASGEARHFRGTLSGSLALDIPDRDPRNMKARLRLNAREAYIGKVPLLKDLYQLMASRSSPSFTEGAILVQVQEGQAVFQEIRLRSNFLDVLGSGTFSLDRGLDFRFKAGNLGTVLLNPFLTYRMQGTLRDFAISVESPLLPGQGASPPREGPVLPDYRDLPERPLWVQPKGR